MSHAISTNQPTIHLYQSRATPPQLLLRKSGLVFHTSAEREIVRDMKEKLCYIAFNSQKEEKLETEHQTTAQQTYKLPDGRVVHVGPERFRAPELLFNPGLIGQEYRGAHEMLADSIFRSDLDIRKALLGQIVLAGGSTMFPGYGERMLHELRKLTQKAAYGQHAKIRITAPPNRDRLTWVGGSILASLATFKSMWVRKDEYDEMGAAALHRKGVML
jgi:centractin